MDVSRPVSQSCKVAAIVSLDVASPAADRELGAVRDPASVACSPFGKGALVVATRAASVLVAASVLQDSPCWASC